MCSTYKSYSAESSRIYTSDEFFLSKTTNYPSLVDNSSSINPVFRQKWGQNSSSLDLTVCTSINLSERIAHLYLDEKQKQISARF